MNIIFLVPKAKPKTRQTAKTGTTRKTPNPKTGKTQISNSKNSKNCKNWGYHRISTEPQHTRLSLRTVTAGWSMHQCIVLGALRASPVRRLSGRGLWRQGQRVERVRDVGLEPAKCKTRPSSPCDTRGAAPDNPFCCFYYTRDAVV